MIDDTVVRARYLLPEILEGECLSRGFLASIAGPEQNDAKNQKKEEHLNNLKTCGALFKPYRYPPVP